MTSIRIGTRGSALATAQAKQIADRLSAAAKADVELVTITTHGDTSSDPLASLGGTGVFASRSGEALLAGRCDLIVHSLKDLPTEGYPGLRIGAVPRRADARDAVCGRDGLTLDTLPEGSRVGTGSPRRMAQLRSARPDLEVVDIRGNVDTRLARVGAPVSAPVESRLDAVILAVAGLERLGRSDAATQVLNIDDWPTAPGQGALALEVPTNPLSPELETGLRSVNHAGTAACVEAERLVLAGLEAGCAAPIAASALLENELLFLTATVYAPDGTAKLTASHAATPDSRSSKQLGESARDVASRVVAELLGNGAADLAPLRSTKD